MEKMVNLLVVLSLLIFSSCDNSNKLAERGQVSSGTIANPTTGGTGGDQSSNGTGDGLSGGETDCDQVGSGTGNGQVVNKSIADNATDGTDNESMSYVFDFMDELASSTSKSKSDIEKFLNSDLNLTAEDKRKVEEIKGQIKALKDVEKQINSAMSNKEVILLLSNLNELCEKYKVILEEGEDFSNVMKKAIDNLLKKQLTAEDKNEVLKIQKQIDNNSNIKEIIKQLTIFNNARSKMDEIGVKLGSLIRKYNR
jgi:hypothetical protein